MADPRGQDSRLVYSSEEGRVRVPAAPAGRKPSRKPGPPAASPTVPDDGVVRIQRTSKGRGGKTVTAVTGVPGSEDELDAVLKSLKQHCGTGGTREGRVLVLQGDQRDRLLARLSALGFRAKLAGG